MKKARLSVFTIASVMAIMLHGATKEEARQVLREYLERGNEVLLAVHALGYDAFPVLYEMLSDENEYIRWCGRASYIFYRIDGIDPIFPRDSNLASEGEGEALEWARKMLGNEPNQTRGTVRHCSSNYLASKGRTNEDIELLQRKGHYGTAEILAARVAGTNLLRSGNTDFGDYITVFPSVTNTGPQGVYVREILVKALEQSDCNRYKPEIPEELLTMVVSFDENGNPVSNVDLAEYGLSMPVITPKPDKHYRGTYTVIFPHETEPTTPQDGAEVAKPPVDTTQEDISLSEQPQSSPKNKNLLWLGILALAVISAETAWRLIKRKR